MKVMKIIPKFSQFKNHTHRFLKRIVIDLNMFCSTE